MPIAPVDFRKALDGWSPPVSSAGQMFCFLSDALFLLLDRLILPAEAHSAYNVAVQARMVLWQHVGDFRPLGGSNKEKWPARGET